MRISSQTLGGNKIIKPGTNRYYPQRKGLIYLATLELVIQSHQNIPHNQWGAVILEKVSASHAAHPDHLSDRINDSGK